MIRSMTGFARRSASTPSGELLWEVRAVNHRYLEVVFRLPDSLRALEPTLRQLATDRLGRGRVEGALSLRRTASRTAPLVVNEALARELLRAAEAIGRELPVPAPLSALDILRWPGVCEQEEPDPDALATPASEAFAGALEELAAGRAREGARIAAMLEQRCAEIVAICDLVRGRLPEVHERIRDRLRERVAALGVTADPDRLEQELALIAQKLDVSEELDRLQAHVAELRDTVASEEPVGRRLDFLVQELNREANTLASKSADTETTRHAVDLKVLVEQLREQVQNVE